MEGAAKTVIRFGFALALACAVVTRTAAAVGQGASTAGPPATSQADRDWPSWRGPNHNGFMADTDWDPKNPKVLWKVNVGYSHGCISVVGNRAYVPGSFEYHKGKIYCLDADTGKEVWSYVIPTAEALKGKNPANWHGGMFSTPLIDGQVLYTASVEGVMVALDAATGKLIWLKDLRRDEPGFVVPGYGMATSPLPVGELLVWNLCSAGMAVDKKTGRTVWKSAFGDAWHSSPVPCKRNGEEGVLLRNGSFFTILAPTTGKVLLQGEKIGIQYTDPVADGDYLLIGAMWGQGTGPYALYGTDKNGPVRVWFQKDLGGAFGSTPVMRNGVVFTFGPAGCLDGKTGAFRWKEDKVSGTGIIVGDKMIVLTSVGGDLIIADASPDAYKEVSRLHVLDNPPDWKKRSYFEEHCTVPPSFCGGKIFCRNKWGDVVCVDVSKK